MGSDESVRVVPDNDEAAEAWNGVLFDRFAQFRDLIVTGLEQHGRRAMELYPPPAGARALDVGCGFGDASQQLAELVGPEGEVIGVDVSQPFVDAATAEASEAGVENVSFRTGDVQVMDLGGPYDYAFSRMGIMFFANPVQALRNLGSSLKPGGRLVAVVWRRKLDNWMLAPEQVVEQYLEEPDEPEDVRCGPGPFSMANADTVSEQLQIAGFEAPALTRLDLPMRIGDDLDQAVEFAMGLGPAAELLRVSPADEVDELRPKLTAEIREAIAELETPAGVYGPTSTWIVSASVPA